MAFTFPNPQTTPEFTGANGITYSWDATDGKWVVKGFKSSTRERYPELVMQLRGYFELDANGNALVPDDVVTEDDEVTGPDGSYVHIMRPGVYWIDPTQPAGETWYEPSSLTHILVSGLRIVDLESGPDEEIYDDVVLATEFDVGDLIHIQVRGFDVYRSPEYRESIAHSFDNVWRVKSKLNVIDPNPDSWNLTEKFVHAYEVEKCAPLDRYSSYFYIGEGITAPAHVSHWHGAAKDEMVSLNDEVFGEAGGREGPLGRSEFRTYAWDTSNMVDTASKQSYFHPEENFCAFNHDLIPNGRVDWEAALSPYPRQILLEFDDGDELIFTVEFRGVYGYNNRSKNYTITDRGNLPLELDMFIYNQREFNIYLYTPERKSLQQQIDELRALLP